MEAGLMKECFAKLKLDWLINRILPKWELIGRAIRCLEAARSWIDKTIEQKLDYPAGIYEKNVAEIEAGLMKEFLAM